MWAFQLFQLFGLLYLYIYIYSRSEDLTHRDITKIKNIVLPVVNGVLVDIEVDVDAVVVVVVVAEVIIRI